TVARSSSASWSAPSHAAASCSTRSPRRVSASLRPFTPRQPPSPPKGGRKPPRLGPREPQVVVQLADAAYLLGEVRREALVAALWHGPHQSHLGLMHLHLDVARVE